MSRRSDEASFRMKSPDVPAHSCRCIRCHELTSVPAGPLVTECATCHAPFPYLIITSPVEVANAVLRAMDRVGGTDDA